MVKNYFRLKWSWFEIYWRCAKDICFRKNKRWNNLILLYSDWVSKRFIKAQIILTINWGDKKIRLKTLSRTETITHCFKITRLVHERNHVNFIVCNYKAVFYSNIAKWGSKIVNRAWKMFCWKWKQQTIIKINH